MAVRNAVVSIVAFAVAVAISLVVTGGLGASEAQVSQTTSTSSSVPTTAAVPQGEYFVDPYETVIATSALIPVELDIRDDSVNLDFEIVSLAPAGETETMNAFVQEAGFDGFSFDEAPIYPVEWSLTLADGTVTTATITNPEVSVARFDISSPIDTSEIEMIEITRYLVSTPLDVGFTVSDVRPNVEIFPGVTVSLVRRTDQDGQTIVEVEATSDVAMQGTWIHILGDGPQWRSSVRGSQGAASWSLAWLGDDHPDDIPLRVVGTAWIAGEGPVEVSIEGVR